MNYTKEKFFELANYTNEDFYTLKNYLEKQFQIESWIQTTSYPNNLYKYLYETRKCLKKKDSTFVFCKVESYFSVDIMLLIIFESPDVLFRKLALKEFL